MFKEKLMSCPRVNEQANSAIGLTLMKHMPEILSSLLVHACRRCWNRALHVYAWEFVPLRSMALNSSRCGFAAKACCSPATGGGGQASMRQPGDDDIAGSFLCIMASAMRGDKALGALQKSMTFPVLMHLQQQESFPIRGSGFGKLNIRELQRWRRPTKHFLIGKLSRWVGSSSRACLRNPNCALG